MDKSVISYPSQLLQMMIFSVDESGKSIVNLEGKSGKTISIGCRFPPKFANSGTLAACQRPLLKSHISYLPILLKKHNYHPQRQSSRQNKEPSTYLLFVFLELGFGLRTGFLSYEERHDCVLEGK